MNLLIHHRPDIAHEHSRLIKELVDHWIALKKKDAQFDDNINNLCNLFAEGASVWEPATTHTGKSNIRKFFETSATAPWQASNLGLLDLNTHVFTLTEGYVTARRVTVIFTDYDNGAEPVKIKKIIFGQYLSYLVALLM